MLDILLGLAVNAIEVIGDCIEDVDIDVDDFDTDVGDSFGSEDYSGTVSFCGIGDDVDALESQLASAESQLKTYEENMAGDINLGRLEYLGKDRIDIDHAKATVESLKNALARARG